MLIFFSIIDYVEREAAEWQSDRYTRAVTNTKSRQQCPMLGCLGVIILLSKGRNSSTLWTEVYGR